MNYLIYTLSFITLVVTTISLFMYFDKKHKEKVINRMLNLSIYLNVINWLIILANYLIN